MSEITKTPNTENEYLLEVNNLVKWFPIKTGFFKRTTGHVKAVDGVSFKIRRRETMGLGVEQRPTTEAMRHFYAIRSADAELSIKA